MIAREAFPDGPGLDMTLADMEEYAVAETALKVVGEISILGVGDGLLERRRGESPWRSPRVAIVSRHSRGGREGSRH
ncbi:MAG: hypothetical protein GXY83_30200 [Rhodopirellula sp.]|nr:hypothetical protein [Rhodopirellula sp.]